MNQHMLDTIGNTPLVKIPWDTPAPVYAKLEYFNPGGSVKDRPALYIIEDAEKKGILKPGSTIIDASSGNHGIAVAMIGAIKGYKVIITVPEKISEEKLKSMMAYGAQIVMCPNTTFIEESNSHYQTARWLCSQIPDSFMPHQHYNQMNADAHYRSLGPEIWRQSEGMVTHFFAGAGTGGTITGAGRYLKEQNPRIKVIALDSPNSYCATKGNPKPFKLEGMGLIYDSPIIDHTIVDQVVNVTDEDAFDMLRILAQQYGFLLGLSSGAGAYGAYQLAKKLTPHDCVVVVFGDSGRAYLSTNVYTQNLKNEIIKYHKSDNLLERLHVTPSKILLNS